MEPQQGDGLIGYRLSSIENRLERIENRLFGTSWPNIVSSIAAVIAVVMTFITSLIR